MNKAQEGTNDPRVVEDSDGAASVLDHEPEARPKKGRSVRVKGNRRGGVRVDIPVEALQEGADLPDGAQPSLSGGFDREPVSMVDIDSAQPRLTESIVGQLAIEREEVQSPVCADGVTKAECGDCGNVPDSPSYRREVGARWGGGTYIARGLDKNGKAKAVRFKVAGPPKPIPGTPVAIPEPASPTGYVDDEGNPYEIPEEASVRKFQPRGDPRFFDPQIDPRSFGAQPQAGSPYYSPYSSGFDQEKEQLKVELAEMKRKSEIEALERTYDSKLERLIEKIGGGQPKVDPELAQRLARIEIALEGKGHSNALSDMMANQIAMIDKRNADADKQRAHELALAQLKAKADEDERKARATADAAAAVELKKLELQAVQAKADAEKHAATVNADAAKEAAKSNATMAQEMARVQGDANEKVIAAITNMSNKQDSVPLLMQGVRLAADLQGGKSGNTAVELVDAIGRSAPDLISHVGDAFTRWRASKPAAPAENPPTAPSGDELLQRFLQLFVTYANKGLEPRAVRQHLGTAFMVTGLDADKAKKEEILSTVRLATPAILAGYLERSANAFKSEPLKKEWLAARDWFGTEDGKAWFAAIKAELFPARPAIPVAPPPVAIPAAPEAPKA